ncbi:MAG: YbfB/YjiJ family MFS transporter, partial [Firmicutes bacterium]|nr:YbfB/YjiJ family MFS transporter [Bacillota bacterium]
MMAITTNSSMRVKPRLIRVPPEGRLCASIVLRHRRTMQAQSSRRGSCGAAAPLQVIGRSGDGQLVADSHSRRSATLAPRPLAHTAVVRAGLVATVLLTLGMAQHAPALWPLWRFLAGVASALVFVYGSLWCLARLSALGAPALGGLMFVGPGLGIAFS